MRFATVPPEWLIESTMLTSAQHYRLDGLPATSRVIAWDHARYGPVILADDDRRHVITPRGRLTLLRGER